MAATVPGSVKRSVGHVMLSFDLLPVAAGEIMAATCLFPSKKTGLIKGAQYDQEGKFTEVSVFFQRLFEFNIIKHACIKERYLSSM